jgi:hypothetical protein
LGDGLYAKGLAICDILVSFKGYSHLFRGGIYCLIYYSYR